jgi:uncharacterized OB-fold protein
VASGPDGAAPCPRCGAEQPPDRRFCTSCGYALGDAPEVPAAPARPTAEPRFVACPACGATNAASRRRCGRCHGDLADDQPAPAAGRIDGAAEDEVATGAAGDRGSPLVFAAAIAVAAAAILGVILTILSASGVGPLATPVADPLEPDVPIAFVAVRASSVLPAVDGEDHEPENLVDADPTTAWREAASGDGRGEWFELQLAGNPAVERLLLWIGHQGEGRFAQVSRPASVRIDLGDRTFTADLLDVDGLPEAVEASTVRVTVLAVTPADDANLAVSQVEVRGTLAPDADGEPTDG